MKTIIRTLAVVTMLLTTGLLTDGVFNVRIIVKEAGAVVGRPMTPGSAAGVRRRTAVRTTRRVIRRTTVYVATLPMGCTTIVIEGNTLQQCGGTYYQSHGSQYVVVEVD
jgi:hypothetical protein